MKLDETDNRILEIIKDDARLTYREIGERAGISRVSVKARMDALQEKGNRLLSHWHRHCTFFCTCFLI